MWSSWPLYSTLKVRGCCCSLFFSVAIEIPPSESFGEKYIQIYAQEIIYSYTFFLSDFFSLSSHFFRGKCIGWKYYMYLEIHNPNNNEKKTILELFFKHIYLQRGDSSFWHWRNCRLLSLRTILFDHCVLEHKRTMPKKNSSLPSPWLSLVERTLNNPFLVVLLFDEGL